MEKFSSTDYKPITCKFVIVISTLFLYYFLYYKLIHFPLQVGHTVGQLHCPMATNVKIKILSEDNINQISGFSSQFSFFFPNMAAFVNGPPKQKFIFQQTIIFGQSAEQTWRMTRSGHTIRIASIQK